VIDVFVVREETVKRRPSEHNAECRSRSLGPDDVNTVIDAAPRFGAPPTRAVT
jgi:hypothetical protein